MSAEKHTDHSGQAHGSVKEYVTGLILSIVLTVIPFAMVMNGQFGETTTLVVIILTAVAQVLVQMIFFLHMNGSSEQTWLTMSAVYTVFILLFVIVGTLWVFEHLNHNMLMGH
ncbi:MULTISPECIES: cytochrome o ubiquinol oxidase subunit IV [unclassified Vibrio]|uniref:Cytochrome bo(3) ubiquinol oxidase subunit 4 n=1 Tax=Vibrio sp. HB236076 TaxID=3232307 RepID=A0AB39HFF1_9VIBR|nr:cytochrome o ubiquinol oxidase subunit IV [Vibrio sp. HB161653]MDP5255527.1 cytochrome o ubiquinol oxidase subunit IV [Vibrio sp. HB161653]